MTVTRTTFTARRAPCGRLTDGEHSEFRDDQGLISAQMVFDCGCKTSREEYHDGSIEQISVKHDGKLLRHETIAEHGA
jgi:hypothetical protein